MEQPLPNPSEPEEADGIPEPLPTINELGSPREFSQNDEVQVLSLPDTQLAEEEDVLAEDGEEMAEGNENPPGAEKILRSPQRSQIVTRKSAANANSQLYASASATATAAAASNVKGKLKGTPSERREKSLKIHLRKSCSCKNSKCLKLYCDCFAAGEYCKSPDCSCQGCENDPAHDITRKNAIFATLQRNPGAFKPKLNGPPLRIPAKTNSAGTTDHAILASPTKSNAKSCSCKRVGDCAKANCECFQANLSCTETCVCQGCKNSEKLTSSEQPLSSPTVSPKRKQADSMPQKSLSPQKPPPEEKTFSEAEFYSQTFTNLFSGEQIRKLGNVLIMAAHHAETNFLKKEKADEGAHRTVGGKSKGAPLESPTPGKRQRGGKNKSPPGKSLLTMESLKSLESGPPQESPLPKETGNLVEPGPSTSTSASTSASNLQLTPLYVAQERAILTELRHCLERVMETATELRDSGSGTVRGKLDLQ